MLSFFVIMAKKNTNIDVAIIANDISYIKQELDDIKKRLDQQYVTRVEFDGKMKSLMDKYDPGLKLIYGMVTLVLTGVMGALLALVINKQ